MVSAEGSHEVVTSSARWSPAFVFYKRFPRSIKKPFRHRKVGKKRKERALALSDSTYSGSGDKNSTLVVFITSFRGANPRTPCGLSRKSACTSLNAAAKTLRSPRFRRAINRPVVFTLDALPGQGCEILLGSCEKVVFSTDHNQVFQSVNDSGCPMAKIHFRAREGCRQKLEVLGKRLPPSCTVTFLMLHFINPKILVSPSPRKKASVNMRHCIVHIGSVNTTETPIVIAVHASFGSLEITNVTLVRVARTRLVPWRRNRISLIEVDCDGYCSVSFTNSTFRGFTSREDALHSVVKVMYKEASGPDSENFFVMDGCKIVDMGATVQSVFSIHMPTSAVSAVITGSVFANVSAGYVATFTGFEAKGEIRNSNLQKHVNISINRCVFRNIPSDVIKVTSIPAAVNLQLTDNTIAMVRGHFVTLYESSGVLKGCGLFST